MKNHLRIKRKSKNKVTNQGGKIINLKSKILNLKSGFTLIETIIYMGLLAAILLVITNLMITTSYFSQEETARLEIQKNGRFAIERIIRDLQAADSVTIPADSTPTNNLVIGDISYQLSSDRLTRTDLDSTENVTNNSVQVDSLEFSRIENPGGKTSIKIKITVNYIGLIEGNRDISQDFGTTFYLK